MFIFLFLFDKTICGEQDSEAQNNQNIQYNAVKVTKNKIESEIYLDSRKLESSQNVTALENQSDMSQDLQMTVNSNPNEFQLENLRPPIIDFKKFSISSIKENPENFVILETAEDFLVESPENNQYSKVSSLHQTNHPLNKREENIFSIACDNEGINIEESEFFITTYCIDKANGEPESDIMACQKSQSIEKDDLLLSHLKENPIKENEYQCSTFPRRTPKHLNHHYEMIDPEHENIKESENSTPVKINDLPNEFQPIFGKSKRLETFRRHSDIGSVKKKNKLKSLSSGFKRLIGLNPGVKQPFKHDKNNSKSLQFNIEENPNYEKATAKYLRNPESPYITSKDIEKNPEEQSNINPDPKNPFCQNTSTNSDLFNAIHILRNEIFILTRRLEQVEQSNFWCIRERRRLHKKRMSENAKKNEDKTFCASNESEIGYSYALSYEIDSILANSSPTENEPVYATIIKADSESDIVTFNTSSTAHEVLESNPDHALKTTSKNSPTVFERFKSVSFEDSEIDISESSHDHKSKNSSGYSSTDEKSPRSKNKSGDSFCFPISPIIEEDEKIDVQYSSFTTQNDENKKQTGALNEENDENFKSEAEEIRIKNQIPNTNAESDILEAIFLNFSDKKSLNEKDEQFDKLTEDPK